MSLHLEFEPHSWYMGFAIKKHDDYNDPCEFEYGTDRKICIVHDRTINPYYDYCEGYSPKWKAYIDNGMTGYVNEVHAETLKELKEKIKQYTKRNKERWERLYRETN